MTDRSTVHNSTESMVKTDQAESERRIKIAKEIETRQSDRDIPKKIHSIMVLGVSKDCQGKNIQVW
jgi:hypothetical protein